MKYKGLIVAVVVLILVVVIPVGMYNGLVRRDVAVTTAWSQVENVLQRRADLIPNLVSSVKGYMKHEKEILDNLAKARTQYTGAKTFNEKLKAGALMEGALARLLVIVENYPNLKANETFNRLMDELAGTENRIAVERKRYNESVQDLNTTIRRVPYNLIANQFNFKAKPFFEAESGAKAVPKVDFETTK
ncbi:MAG: LemA family protein [Elusimicrobia bacterium]|nr:LemA family protein [Elusimicrobiota bacterium]